MAALLANTSPPVDCSYLFEQIAEGLATKGYVVLPAALPEFIGEELVSGISALPEGEFYQAAVGRGSDQVVSQFIRRDKITWVEESMAPKWLEWVGQLKTYLNQRLFLGLFSFESQFAIYNPGDFYKTHLDAFKGNSNRRVSLVTYLNKGWHPEFGGELVIYDGQSDEGLKVQPNYGTLVLFLSDEFPHEVLPATRDRYSIAGWFRVNESTNGTIDPPK